MLSEEQIQYLYKFCNKHLVFYYDIQIELVDHLANAIEEKMTADKSLTFDAALDKVYKGFGIFGFANIVKEKTKQVNKKWEKIYLGLLKDELGWPKLLVFLLISTVVYTTFNWSDTAGMIVSGLIFIFACYRVSGDFKKLNRFTNQTKKKFLMGSYGSIFPFFSFILNLYYPPVILSTNAGFGNLSHIFFGVLSGLLVVVVRSQKNLSVRIIETLGQEYPEVFSPTTV